MVLKPEELKRVRLEFYEEDVAAIDQILRKFLSAAQAKCALLVDKDGHLVTQAGFTRAFDTTSLAALVAGAFASTKEMARILGEVEFSVIFHQGKNEHIHISLVSERSLMVIVFDDRTTIGMVRLYAEGLAKEVGRVLDRILERSRTQKPRPLAADFAADAETRLADFFDQPGGGPGPGSQGHGRPAPRA